MTKGCDAGCGLSNFGLSSCEGQHALLWYPCLPAQVPFRLEAVLSHLEKILEERGHVVVCIAEGAGQVRARPEVCTWGQSTWSRAGLPFRAHQSTSMHAVGQQMVGRTPIIVEWPVAKQLPQIAPAPLLCFLQELFPHCSLDSVGMLGGSSGLLGRPGLGECSLVGLCPDVLLDAPHALWQAARFSCTQACFTALPCCPLV